MQWYSQLKQDVFAYNNSQKASYIEIGAWKPEHYSNTFLLETNNWKGFSLELDTTKKHLWNGHPNRNNTVYWTDALEFDYISALTDQGMDTHIGYLSVDIEPPENTFAALKRVIEQGIQFDCITFEHDKYRNEVDYDPIATDFLKEHGYKVAVKNVFRYKRHRDENGTKIINKCYMETWYIRNDIDFIETDYETWLLENK